MGVCRITLLYIGANDSSRCYIVEEHYCRLELSAIVDWRLIFFAHYYETFLPLHVNFEELKVIWFKGRTKEDILETRIRFV